MKLFLRGNAQNTAIQNYGGNYIIEENTIYEDRQNLIWKKRWGNIALWWDNTYNCWALGDLYDKETSKAKIKGPSNNDNFPNLISSGWCYCNDQIENKIVFEDLEFRNMSNFKGKQIVFFLVSCQCLS